MTLTTPLAISLRPRRLDSMIGAESIVKKIRGRMSTGREPLAWLFFGTTGCLAEGTLIDIPRNLAKYPLGVPIEKLLGKTPYLYAFDRKEKRFVVTRAGGVYKTGEHVPVYKVSFKRCIGGIGGRLDMPMYVEATSDHRFLVRKESEITKKIRNMREEGLTYKEIGERIGIAGDRVYRLYAGKAGCSFNSDDIFEYKRVDELVEGDRLVPLFRCLKSDTYSIIRNGFTGESDYEHKFILSAMYGSRPSAYQGHHRNENKFDNRVSNLEWKYYSEHHRDHAIKANAEGGYLGWQNNSGVHPKGMIGKEQTLLQRQTTSKVDFVRWENWRKKHAWYDRELLIDLFLRKGFTKQEIADRYDTGVHNIRSALKRFGIPVINNHAVKSVEFVGYKDVYDITVPKYHNFVANGVVVHNSGKTTIMKIMALAFQCEHQKVFGNPCKECYKARHEFDILEVNASDVTKIDDLRIAVGDRWHYSPYPGSRRKVIILDELQKLSDSSQNYLLKLFEEGPETTVWMCGTSRPENIDVALRRRCANYVVPALDLEATRALAKKAIEVAGGDRDSDDLTDSLMEAGINSPGLILNAVEKYLEDNTVSSDVAVRSDGVTEVDVRKLNSAIFKGNWRAAAAWLSTCNSRDANQIRRKLAMYLRVVLVNDTDFSDRNNVLAESIKILAGMNYVGDELQIAGICAVAYEIAKMFQAGSVIKRDEE